MLTTYRSTSNPQVITFEGLKLFFQLQISKTSASSQHQISEIFFSGVVDDDIDFVYGDSTEIMEGCAVTYYGRMLYFGGRSEQRQVFFHFF